MFFVRCPAVFKFSCENVCWCPGASILLLRSFELVDACKLLLNLCSAKDVTRVMTLGPYAALPPSQVLIAGPTFESKITLILQIAAVCSYGT
jgi:hypothetical protein